MVYGHAIPQRGNNVMIKTLLGTESQSTPLGLLIEGNRNGLPQLTCYTLPSHTELAFPMGWYLKGADIGRGSVGNVKWRDTIYKAGIAIKGPASEHAIQSSNISSTSSGSCPLSFHLQPIALDRKENKLSNTLSTTPQDAFLTSRHRFIPLCCGSCYC